MTGKKMKVTADEKNAIKQAYRCLMFMILFFNEIFLSAIIKLAKISSIYLLSDL